MTTTLTERHTLILQLLRKKGYVSVSELSERSEVSEMTIRRDLDTLDELGLITRHHGGASLSNDLQTVEEPYSSNEKNHREVNIKIGRLAANYIKDSDVIILDSGPTTLQIAINLLQQHPTVVTNSLPIIYELSRYQNVNVISAGGQLLESNNCFVGPLAIQTIKSINANIAFISAAGFSLGRGVTVPNLLEAEIKRAMIQVAEKVYVVMESHKLDNISLATVCSADKIDMLITDECISDEDRDAIQRKGIEVVMAAE